MMKYLVKRPWVGVNKGDVIETDNLHPALLPNVEVLEVQSFEVATPKETDPYKMNVADLKNWLTSAEIDFPADAKKSDLQDLID